MLFWKEEFIKSCNYILFNLHCFIIFFFDLVLVSKYTITTLFKYRKNTNIKRVGSLDVSLILWNFMGFHLYLGLWNCQSVEVQKWRTEYFTPTNFNARGELRGGVQVRNYVRTMCSPLSCTIFIGANFKKQQRIMLRNFLLFHYFFLPI